MERHEITFFGILVSVVLLIGGLIIDGHRTNANIDTNAEAISQAQAALAEHAATIQGLRGDVDALLRLEARIEVLVIDGTPFGAEVTQ